MNEITLDEDFLQQQFWEEFESFYQATPEDYQQQS